MASQDDTSPELTGAARSSRPISSLEATQSSPSRSQSHEDNAISSVAEHPISDPVPSSNPRLEALAQRRAVLEVKLASLQAERANLAADAPSSSVVTPAAAHSEEETTAQAVAAAQMVIKRHITLLKRYNEIKDIGQGMMGMIAHQRGVRVGRVMDEFGMTDKD